MRFSHFEVMSYKNGGCRTAGQDFQGDLDIGGAFSDLPVTQPRESRLDQKGRARLILIRVGEDEISTGKRKRVNDEHVYQRRR